MAEGAALLADHVLPAVGYRQWVLSFPGPMAVRLGYDAPLLAAIAGRLARAVMQDMRRSVKQQHGLASVASLHAGVVTVVQRFRSDPLPGSADPVENLTGTPSRRRSTRDPIFTWRPVATSPRRRSATDPGRRQQCFHGGGLFSSGDACLG